VGGTCAHCGLPLGRRSVRGTVEGEQGSFCCYGCLLALQVTRARGEAGAAASILVRLGLAIFFTINVMMLSMPAYAPYVYGGAQADGPLFLVLRVLALVFTAPVLVLLGGPILASAWRGGGLNTDALIVVATGAAYVLSVVNTLAGRAGVYCDTAAMLLVLVTLGRWLEASARAEAGAAVRAMLSPGPAYAIRVREGVGERVAPAALSPGDEVEVAPGAAFPTDGVVLDGVGGADESALTGESQPVAKLPGATVAGGTCSRDGLFRVRVTAPASESAAARIAGLIEAAGRERTAAERTADRVVARLVPAVIAIALGAGAWWTARGGVEHGLLAALAVLVVACPCALGLATPVAVWTGLAAAVRRGVIVRRAAVLERAAEISYVLFDKTGTLTDGMPRLARIEPAEGVEADAVLARAAAVEAGLRHPLAIAIGTAARERRLAIAGARDVRIIPGRGVHARVGGEATVVGSLALAQEAIGAPGASQMHGVGVVAGQRLLGTLHFAEAARDTAPAAIAALRRLGIHVGLSSGDTRAAAVVPGLLASADAALGLLPEDKVARVGALRARAGGGSIAMVGDGINDAPALAAADVGIAVADATDLARLTADVVVVGADLRKIPWLLAHARRVRRVIRQSLAWAFAYNTVAVGLAASGILTPVVASLAMLASSIAVVANARRLAGTRGDEGTALHLAASDSDSCDERAAKRDRDGRETPGMLPA
jgi:heavy metal translocating P-type ATPase